MKRILTGLLCLALLQRAAAQDPAYPAAPAAPQTIVSAEYFFDSDPGFGNATPIAITPGVNLASVAASVNTAGLSNGIHRFCLRTRSTDGGWGLTAVVEFLADYNPAYTTTGTVQNLSRAEYFVDTDPGFGSATAIAVTPGTNLSNVSINVATAGLSNGVHKLWLRTQDVNGKWSLTNTQDFLIDFNPPYPVAPATQNVAKAEYFIDADPGFGKATSISVAPATDVQNVPTAVNTAGLSVGVHHLYLRSQGADGKWGLTNQSDFLVDINPAYPTPPTAPGNLVYAEYFFDTDPGYGKGTPVTFAPSVNLTNVTISVNTASLSNGNHKFFLRTMDDWSMTGYQSFLVGTPLPLHFLSFYAQNKEHSVALQWRTDNEINTAYFGIERSRNGQDFETIGTVTALNQSGVQLYSFNDAQPLEGKGFYRLKQMDKDGKYTYSNTLLINRSKTVELQVFPNPAHNMLMVVVPLQTASQKLLLINASGQTVKEITVAAGSGNISLSLTDLLPGHYFIRWQNGDDVRVKGFEKL